MTSAQTALTVTASTALSRRKAPTPSAQTALTATVSTALSRRKAPTPSAATALSSARAPTTSRGWTRRRRREASQPGGLSGRGASVLLLGDISCVCL